LLSKLEAIIPEDNITWVAQETRGLYAEILELVRSSDGALNFHDALMALVCQQFGIMRIASFDRDFDQVDWLIRIERPSELIPVDST
jgi:predicted nucleic acid-binding protein